MAKQDTVNEQFDADMPSVRKMTRDEIRASTFSAAKKKPKSKIVHFFGNDIELRQGPLAQLFVEKEDKQAAIVDFLCLNSYVPGTDERLYEEADADQLLQMPFGEDFVRVTEALQELTGANFIKQSNS